MQFWRNHNVALHFYATIESRYGGNRFKVVVRNRMGTFLWRLLYHPEEIQSRLLSPHPLLDPVLFFTISVSHFAAEIWSPFYIYSMFFYQPFRVVNTKILLVNM